MNIKTVALTKEQYQTIIQTMKQGFTGCRPNERIATALTLEANLPVQRWDTPNQIHADQPDLPSGTAARLRAEKQIARRVGVRSTESHAGIGEGHAGDDLHPPRGGADDLESVAAARSGRWQENLRLSAKADEKAGGRDRRPNGAAAHRGNVLPNMVGTAMSGGGLLFRGEETSTPTAVSAKGVPTNQERRNQRGGASSHEQVFL